MILDGLRVMVLEDEPIIALGVEDLLIELGARPAIAERLDEASALLAAGPVDAAILDVNVHGGRSYDIAEQLLAAGIPFVFATGYGERGHPDLFSAITTLTKPYGTSEIESAFAALAPRDAGR